VNVTADLRTARVYLCSAARSAQGAARPEAPGFLRNALSRSLMIRYTRLDFELDTSIERGCIDAADVR